MQDWRAEMGLLRSIAREMAGLFIDDGSLAVVLLAWMVGGTIALRFLHAGHWGGPVLAVGLAAVLMENVVRSSRHRRTRSRASRHQD
jgi:hypothetical protein